jgi:Virulence factor
MRYQVLYWQDVPSLVKVLNDDGTSVSQQLPDWFQQEIDRRAMEQGLIGSDAYLEEWRWGPAQESEGDAASIAAAIASAFDKG